MASTQSLQCSLAFFHWLLKTLPGIFYLPKSHSPPQVSNLSFRKPLHRIEDRNLQPDSLLLSTELCHVLEAQNCHFPWAFTPQHSLAAHTSPAPDGTSEFLPHRLSEWTRAITVKILALKHGNGHLPRTRAQTQTKNKADQSPAPGPSPSWIHSI